MTERMVADDRAVAAQNERRENRRRYLSHDQVLIKKPCVNREVAVPCESAPD
jgi:hypothetical protein